MTALAGLAQLFILSAHLTRRAAVSGNALMAAQTKLETLRGLSFAYDVTGGAVTDPALQPSPPSSLDEDFDATVDWVDRHGEVVASADAAALVRRWRVSTLTGSMPDAIAIEVCVFGVPVGGADHRSAQTCLSSVRVRQP